MVETFIGISDIKEIVLTQERRVQKHNSFHSEEERDFQILVGQLNCISTQTRPDLLFYVCDLSTKMKSAVIEEIIYGNKILVHANKSRINYVF